MTQEKQEDKRRYIAGYVSRFYGGWSSLALVEQPTVVPGGLLASLGGAGPNGCLFPISNGWLQDYELDNRKYVARGPLSDDDIAKLDKLRAEYKKKSDESIEAYRAYSDAVAKLVEFTPLVFVGKRT